MLEVRGLTKRFGGLTAVDRCDLTLGEGRVTGLIGPNGAGKTTLFNLIAGTIRPSAGRILFRGGDITRLPAQERFHRGIVRTFQIPHEFARLSVLENLMVVPAGQDGERLWEAWFRPADVAAREAEIAAAARETLDFLRLSHLAGERAGNLSGGQKKLLELGRAMMAEPAIVLLDEPGAGVNPTLLAELAHMIERLAVERGYTFCIIEHNMDMIARLCDPVIVMAEGRVLTQGTIGEVRADARVIEAYLGGAAAEAEA
jgi:branched-chain amino acid transport system ATP-binding protein